MFKMETLEDGVGLGFDAGGARSQGEDDHSFGVQDGEKFEDGVTWLRFWWVQNFKCEGDHLFLVFKKEKRLSDANGVNFDAGARSRKPHSFDGECGDQYQSYQ